MAPRGGTQVFVASDDKNVIVAFRGTQFAKPRDILADVKMGPALGYGGKVHQGTQQALALVISKVIEAIKAHDAAGKKAVWVTGHSLGGSLACLAAVRLQGAGSRVRGVYTVAQFRVGDLNFAKSFSAPLYRIVNENDPVPYAPLVMRVGVAKTLAFKHAGRMYFFDTKGRYQPRQLSAPTFTLARTLWVIKNGFPTPHDMGIYSNRVWDQLPAALKKAWPKPY